MGQCVTLVISSRYSEFAGSVLSVQTMTCVLSATIATSIICDIGFFGLTHLEVKGLYAEYVFTFVCRMMSFLSITYCTYLASTCPVCSWTCSLSKPLWHVELDCSIHWPLVGWRTALWGQVWCAVWQSSSCGIWSGIQWRRGGTTVHWITSLCLS